MVNGKLACLDRFALVHRLVYGTAHIRYAQLIGVYPYYICTSNITRMDIFTAVLLRLCTGLEISVYGMSVFSTLWLYTENAVQITLGCFL